MKKILIVLGAFIATTFAACNKQAATTETVDETLGAAVDSIEVVVDSADVDSVVEVVEVPVETPAE